MILVCQLTLIHYWLGLRSFREELLGFSSDSHSVSSLFQLICLVLLIFHHFWRLHPLRKFEVVLKTGVLVENFFITINHQGRLRLFSLVTVKAAGRIVFVLHLFEFLVESGDYGGILGPRSSILL